MKYVIEKDGAKISPVTAWTPGLAKKCGLAGNLNPPSDLPYSLKDGNTLRVSRSIKVTKGDYQMVIEDNGALVGDEWVITQSAVDVSVDQAKPQALAKIKQKRNAILGVEFNWLLEGVNYRFQGSDADLTKMERSRDLLTENIARGVSAADAIMAWRTSDNDWTPALSPAQINDMAFSKGQQNLTCWARYRTLEAEILSEETTTVTKIRALGLEAGWPEVVQATP